jgi:hypothetical protein
MLYDPETGDDYNEHPLAPIEGGEYAFSKRSRDIIRRRAGGRSELSGRVDTEMHCSHINHNHNRRDYDSPDNGLYLTVPEHLAYHLLAVCDARSIGLSESENSFAVNTLALHVHDDDRAIQQALDMWYELDDPHELIDDAKLPGDWD